ncbi:MAG: hypothetical protein HQL49_01630 [Gammaproteobacteria bacterium]|nr:hypothetical protein [Gammaproteobacteria bacterium]
MLCIEHIPLAELQQITEYYGVTLQQVASHHTIPGSWFGDPEAGIIRMNLYVRNDTPLHSALHELCHLVCMDNLRRTTLDTNAGGGYDEEDAVNYLQILLADQLPCCGRLRMMQDMDSWGYSYRLGSATAWFYEDAEDARQWLFAHQLINPQEQPTWQLRQG